MSQQIGSHVVNINVETHNVDSTLLTLQISTLIYTTLFNVDLTLPDGVTSYQPSTNVETTRKYLLCWYQISA